MVTNVLKFANVKMVILSILTVNEQSKFLGGICDKISGFCACKPGWRGLKCNRICLKGYFGKGCSEPCRCHNNLPCDHITGKW